MSDTKDSSTGAALSPAPLPRSTELMRPCDTGLLLIDAQERLLKVAPDSARIIWNCRRLLDAANILNVRTAVTEQYPERLGATEPCLAERIAAPAHAKLAFSAGACGELFSLWRAEKVERVLLCGIETHVCVAQTAFDLLAAGYQVFVAADAVGARWPIDHEIGLRRMEASGVTITTTEAAIFEWCERAGTPEFKQVSALAKELPPGNGPIVGFRAN